MNNPYIKEGSPIRVEVVVIPPPTPFNGVIENIFDNSLVIKCDRSYLQAEPIKVLCTIHQGEKVCIFPSTLENSNKDVFFVKIPNLFDVKLVQRRQYVRVDFNRDINCYLLSINNEKVNKDKIFSGKIKNLSAGGILLSTPLSLPISTVYGFELVLNNNAFVLKAAVVRKAENTAENINEYGCEFIGLDNEDRKFLIDYCTKLSTFQKK